MTGYSSGSSTPNYKRTMVFIDGTNFLREFAKKLGVDFRADKPPAKAIEAANWLFRPMCAIHGSHGSQRYDVIRRYWFSSYQGNEEDGESLREILRKNHFEPVIFKKKRNGKEKGVDIALTKEMLVNAFNQNFDVGLLIAGDADYIALVNEVKRYGPVVWVAFFSSPCLSSSLRIEADMFIDIMSDFNAAKDSNYLKAHDELFKVLGKK